MQEKCMLLLLCVWVTPCTHASLIITGMMAHRGVYFIELYALGPVTRDSYVLRITDSSVSNVNVPVSDMAANTFIHYGTTSESEMASFLGVTFDNYHYDPDVEIDRGDDMIELYLENVRMDIYGSASLSLSTWEYRGGYSYRKNNACPNPSFTTSEWDINPSTSGFPFKQYSPASGNISIIRLTLLTRFKINRSS